jgi:hypothetical protein
MGRSVDVSKWDTRMVLRVTQYDVGELEDEYDACAVARLATAK